MNILDEIKREIAEAKCVGECTCGQCAKALAFFAVVEITAERFWWATYAANIGEPVYLQCDGCRAIKTEADVQAFAEELHTFAGCYGARFDAALAAIHRLAP